MIEVSEQAKVELKRILMNHVDNPQAGFRLTPAEFGLFGLGIDVEMPGDEVVEHEGSKVLLIAKELAVNLQGITMDVKDTPDGLKIVLLEPPGE
jgi:Fe-S cluster assembly iron-binding protein IscA